MLLHLACVHLNLESISCQKPTMLLCAVLRFQGAAYWATNAQVKPLQGYSLACAPPGPQPPFSPIDIGGTLVPAL